MNAAIFYSTDGSLPTAQSIPYSQPIAVNESLTLKAVNIVNGKVMGLKPAAQSFAMHKAIGSNVVYTNPINKGYMADGPNSLADGVRGTNAAGKYWHGINGKDMIATLDLGEEKSIQSISIGCLQNYKDWIFLPQSVSFEVSSDGVNFTSVQTVSNPVSVKETNAVIHDFKTDFANQKVRFIRVNAKNLGTCPNGHSGEGQPAWVFADEIIVY